jgi:nucleotide-binding universal stress UspA family protein
MYRKILVPLDGSKTAEKVLPYARYLAGKFKMPVELLAVIDIAEMADPCVGGKGAPSRHHDRRRRALQHDLSKRRGDDVSWARRELHGGEGERRRTIISKAEADGATLIAMATHGRSGVNRFLLGSVAEKVLRGSANPLLLVRATEAVPASAAFKSVIVTAGRIGARRERLPVVATMAKAARSRSRAVPRLSYTLHRLRR